LSAQNVLDVAFQPRLWAFWACRLGLELRAQPRDETGFRIGSKQGPHILGEREMEPQQRGPARQPARLRREGPVMRTVGAEARTQSKTASPCQMGSPTNRRGEEKTQREQPPPSATAFG